MKILLPRSQKAREVLYRELNALVPEELRPRHKVVVAKGRFGYYARIVKTGPLTPAELSERRAIGSACVLYASLRWQLKARWRGAPLSRSRTPLAAAGIIVWSRLLEEEARALFDDAGRSYQH
jgi:hypothetical protein